MAIIRHRFFKFYRQHPLFFIGGVFIGLSLGLAVAVIAWTDPTASPPAGNVAAPINVSSTIQSKTGGVNFATTSGSVGIGTATPNPAYKLDVSGTANATTFSGSGASLTSLNASNLSSGTVGTARLGSGVADATTFLRGDSTWAQASVPSGAVMFFNLATCPSGWTELLAARGRYVVGLPLSGTLAGTDGTALSNLEDRPVGQHTHTISPNPHTHSYTGPVTNADWTPAGGTFTGRTSTSYTTGSTSLTINNAGSVVGTNAPYIQLLTCQKT